MKLSLDVSFLENGFSRKEEIDKDFHLYEMAKFENVVIPKQIAKVEEKLSQAFDLSGSAHFLINIFHKAYNYVEAKVKVCLVIDLRLKGKIL